MRECEELGETGKKELCDVDVPTGDATFHRHKCSLCGDFGRDGELWCRWVRL